MSALLLSFAYFALGIVVGLFVSFMLWKHIQLRITANLFKRMLAEQGYVIKDKRIVPLAEGEEVEIGDISAELREELREVIEAAKQ